MSRHTRSFYKTKSSSVGLGNRIMLKLKRILSLPVCYRLMYCFALVTCSIVHSPLVFYTTVSCAVTSSIQLRFDLPCNSWFPTPRIINSRQAADAVCQCLANLHKWGMATSDLCACSQQRTMYHTVDLCSDSLKAVYDSLCTMLATTQSTG